MDQRSPRNTTADVHGNPLSFLAASLGTGGTSQAIEEQERAGQAEILHSTVLPTEGSNNPELLELGFTFGDQVAGDPLFRQATLPEGWTREGSDHAMHSYVCDERGVRRVNVFYKAAFYDRRADMHIVNVGYSAATHEIYGDHKNIALDERLTAEELVDVRASVDNYLEGCNDPVTGHIYANRRPRAERLLELLIAAEVTR